MIKYGMRFAAAALAALLFLSGCGRRQEEDVHPPQGSIDESGSFTPALPDVENALDAATAKNKDVVGWLQVPNTTIDEAVVQSTNNEFYLRKNVEKKYSYEGCYFADYECEFSDSGKILSQNTIIYGHNLGSPLGVRDDPDGAKFAQLLKMEEEETARNTPYFFFVTKGEAYTFQIFAAYYCEAGTTPVPYHYASYRPERFAALTEDAKARSTYLYDVTVNPEDQIMTLSTCTYKYGTYSQNADQRYVVMGRLVKEGETMHPQAEIEKNPNPKEPDFSKK